MNLKKIQFACEILIEQYNHWALFPIALLIMGSGIAEYAIFTPNVWIWVIASLFPFLLYLIRNCLEQILPFVLLHLLLIAVAFMIPTIAHYRVIYVSAAIYYVLNSIILRYRKNTTYSQMMATPLAFGLYFAGSLFQFKLMRGRWDAYFYIPMLIITALFFVIFYIKRYIDFLNVNKSSAGHLPARDMFHSGLKLVLGFTGGCLFFLFLSIFTTVLGNVGKVLSEWILRVLRYLFSLLPESNKFNQPIEKDDYGVSGGMLDVPNRTYFIWELLQYLFLVLLLVAIVFLLIKLIIKLLEFIQGRFKATRKTEVCEEESLDIREKIEIEKRPSRKPTKPFDRFSPTERIRRLYKKKLLTSTVGMSSLDTDKLGIYTACEWEKKLQTNGMAEVYEQARYSSHEMTMTDVKRMKAACKSDE